MSAAVSFYLAGLLEASNCTHIEFVHDNCASPKNRQSVALTDDSATCASSLADAICRWDSSSSSLGTASTATNTTGSTLGSSNSNGSGTTQEGEASSKRKALKPPRRQLSFEDDLDMSVSDRSSQEGAIASQSPPHNRDITVLPCDRQSGSSNDNHNNTSNKPPRPPTRRTSARLKRALQRAAETNLDCFPASKEAPVSTLWRSVSSFNTSVSSLTDTDQFMQRIPTPKSSSPSSSSSSSHESRGGTLDDFLDLKNGLLSSKPLTGAVPVKQQGSTRTPRLKDFSPPRKPQRQGTVEGTEKKEAKPLSPTKLAEHGESLHDLIRLRRGSKASAA